VLRASTGELVWTFQTVHHDLWDYDVPMQPILFFLERAGRAVPAVALVPNWVIFSYSIARLAGGAEYEYLGTPQALHEKDVSVNLKSLYRLAGSHL
jgi:glucose dehydrogenase